MNRAALVMIVAATTACTSAPKLAVAVTHPPGLAVTTTTVTVYESATLHCTDIEFARLDDAGLQALAVQKVEISDTASGGLSGISRTGNKVIVARGYDAQGALISAGCAEKGEVVGDDTVAVTTVIAALVSIRPSNDGLAAEVSITDSTGVSLADARAVSWTVSGPARSSAANPDNITVVSDGVWEPKLPSCASSGAVTVHPNPPSSVGGYAVQIRVAWAIEEPPAYSLITALAFEAIDFGTYTIPTNLKRYCAMRFHGATHHLVCLLGDASMAYEFEVAVTNGKAKVTNVGSTSALPTPAFGATKAVALISEPTGTGTDRDVYAATDRGQLVALFGAAAVTDSPAPFLPGLAVDAMYMPSCGSNSPAKVLISSALTLPNTTVKQIDALGGGEQTLALGTSKFVLDNAGCVTELQASGPPQLLQMATILSGSVFAVDPILLNCTGTTTCTPFTKVSVAKGAGVGFTTGNEPRLVATTVDATGVVLVEVVFSTTTNTTVERVRLPAASIPVKIIAALSAADTDVDLFWNITSRTGSTNFEIAYARKVGGDNLEALSKAQQAFTVTSLEAGDLNGDKLDDILVTAVEGVLIVPLGAALTGQPANNDLTCTP